jgi:hypothetical protein
MTHDLRNMSGRLATLLAILALTALSACASMPTESLPVGEFNLIQYRGADVPTRIANSTTTEIVSGTLTLAAGRYEMVTRYRSGSGGSLQASTSVSRGRVTVVNKEFHLVREGGSELTALEARMPMLLEGSDRATVLGQLAATFTFRRTR